MHAGEELKAANWQQGDLIEEFPGHIWVEEDDERGLVASIKRPGIPTPGLVLSQTCDIVADPAKEPYVEVAKVSTSPPEKVEEWRTGHQRKFVVNVEERQVADIRYCARIRKDLLLKMRRVGSVAPSRRSEFKNWLTNRYNRPAVSEELHEAVFGPGRVFFQALSERDDAVAAAAKKLSSVRISFPEASSDEVKFYLILCSESELSKDDQITVGELAEEFRDALRGTATMVQWFYVTETTISHAEWRATLPLQTTAMTYGGEEIVGPEPSEHVI